LMAGKGNPDIASYGFKPGVSGNPGGRPKGIAAKAREHTDRALEVFVEGLEDPDVKVRLIAAEKILDRGYGKAVAMTADITKKLDDMDDASLDIAIDAIRAAIRAPDSLRAGASEETAH
jgi:uncharacterized protein DUF5681